MNALAAYNSSSSDSDQESKLQDDESCVLRPPTLAPGSVSCTPFNELENFTVELDDQIHPNVKSLHAPSSVARRCSEPEATSSRHVKGYVSKRKRNRVERDSLSSISESPCNSELSVYFRVPSESKFLPKQPRIRNATPTGCYQLPREHGKPVLSVDWHPSNENLLLSSSLDGTVKLWEISPRQRKSVATYSLHTAAVRSGQWVSHNTVVTGGFDRQTLVSDVERGKVLSAFKHDEFVSVVKVHPQERNVIFTGDFGANLQSWDIRSGKKAQQYEGAGGKILDIAFLQKGELVASSDIVRKNACSQALCVWNTISSIVVSKQIYLEPYTCPCLRVHPYRNEFYAQSNGNYIVIFSAIKPYKCNKYRRFEGHEVEGNSVQFDISPDGSLLCSASANGQAVVYDADTTNVVCSLSVSDSSCISVAWHRFNTSTVAVSDWNSNIYILH